MPNTETNPAPNPNNQPEEENRFREILPPPDPSGSTFPPPALPGEMVMTRAEAARCRRQDIRDAACIVWSPGGWWVGAGTGFNRDHPSVTVYESVADAVRSLSRDDSLLYIKFDDSASQDPNAPRRKCSAEALLGPQVVAMIKSAPNNSTFRARIMSRVNEMPPADCDTWEKIKDWIEFNFPKSGSPIKSASRSIGVDVHVAETERGRCNYTRSGRGFSTVVMSEQWLLEVARNCQDEEELTDSIAAHIEEQAREHANINWESEDTSEHDPSDDDRELNYDYRHARTMEQVRDLLRAGLNESEREQLGL